jgi:hypothetical protein
MATTKAKDADQGRSTKSMLLGAAMALFLLATLGCGAAPSADRSREASAVASDGVYRFTLRPEGSKAEATEWIEPATGRWRFDYGERTLLYTGTEYVNLDGASGELRRGSDAFIGYLAKKGPGLDVLTNYVLEETPAVGQTPVLSFSTDTAQVSATLEEVVSSDAAESIGLFEVPTEKITSSMIEVVPGTTTLPVRAYWFGPTLSDHAAVTAVEYSARLTPELRAEGWSDRDEAVDYIVFYELDSAKGKSSALSDQEEPAGEIEVTSQPIELPAAQGAIDAVNGKNGNLTYDPWPRSTVKLASGEEATVIPDVGEGVGRVRTGFLVLTETSLIKVVGQFTLDDIASVAPLLQPVS